MVRCDVEKWLEETTIMLQTSNNPYSTHTARKNISKGFVDGEFRMSIPICSGHCQRLRDPGALSFAVFRFNNQPPEMNVFFLRLRLFAHHTIESSGHRINVIGEMIFKSNKIRFFFGR